LKHRLVWLIQFLPQVYRLKICAAGLGRAGSGIDMDGALYGREQLGAMKMIANYFIVEPPIAWLPL
jgi:hypothetical protein